MSKDVLFLFFLLSIFIGQAQEVYEYDFIVKVGDDAPDFTIRETDGNIYKLSDLRGHIVMLQFTASWCSVCQREMPYIESKLWLTGSKLGLKVIGIDRDEPLEKIEELKKKTGVSYPIAFDANADIFSKYALKQSGVTRNVIVDRNGKIVYLTRLFRLDEFRKMKDFIFKELKKEPVK